MQARGMYFQPRGSRIYMCLYKDLFGGFLWCNQIMVVGDSLLKRGLLLPNDPTTFLEVEPDRSGKVKGKKQNSSWVLISSKAGGYMAPSLSEFLER